MKNRKFLCLLLAMLLVVLAGCGGGGNDDYQGGTVIPNGSTHAPTVTTAPTVPSQPTTTAAPTTPTTTAPETVPDEEENLSLGRIEGGEYINHYIGLRCELDSDWIFYGAEELQEMPDNIGDMMSGSELGDAIANYTQIVDMMAENAEMLTSINVVYTKMTAADRLAYLTMTEEEIIDATLTQKDAMIEAYAQAGITVKSMEKVTVTFMGQQHTAMRTEAETSGVAFYTLQFFYQKLGSYGVTLTLTSYVEDKTEALMALFTKI